MEWTDVSERARETMELIGNYGPTITAEHRQVRGWSLDDEGDPVKCYLTAADLRLMAVDLVEVADWLDRRAGDAADVGGRAGYCQFCDQKAGAMHGPYCRSAGTVVSG